MRNKTLPDWKYPEDARFGILLAKHGNNIVSSTECRKRLRDSDGKPMPSSSFTNMRYEFPESFPQPIWPVPSERTLKGGAGVYWYLWSEVHEWFRSYYAGEITEIRWKFAGRDIGWVQTSGPPPARSSRRRVPLIFEEFGNSSTDTPLYPDFDDDDLSTEETGAETGEDFPVVETGAKIGKDSPVAVVDLDDADWLNLDDVELGKRVRERMLSKMGPFTVTLYRNGIVVAEFPDIEEDSEASALLTAATLFEAQ